QLLDVLFGRSLVGIERQEKLRSIPQLFQENPQLLARPRPQMAEVPAALQRLAFETGANPRRELRQRLGQCSEILACDIVSPASLLDHQSQRQQEAIGLRIGNALAYSMIAFVPERNARCTQPGELDIGKIGHLDIAKR